MQAKPIAIVAHGPSDLSDYLVRIPDLDAQLIHPDKLGCFDLDKFDAFFLLGGPDDEHPLDFLPPQRLLLEGVRKPGVRFFCSYCRSFGNMYTLERRPTHFTRLVCTQGAQAFGLTPGTLLDDYASADYPQAFLPRSGKLLLARCGRPMAHSQTAPPQQADVSAQQWALWQETDDLMVCSLPLSNFIRARFAPHAPWTSLVQGIIRWTCGLSEDAKLPALLPCYQLGGNCTDPSEQPPRGDTFHQRVRRGVDQAIRWYTAAGILQDGGRQGLYEGLSAAIAPSGHQPYAPVLRTDCSGEASLAFFAHGLLQDNRESLEISDRLEAYSYENMMVHGGLLDGMLRWTQHAWGVCYGDDVARFVLATLYKAKYTGQQRHFDKVKRALDFLLRTTGSDGLRPARTDAYLLTDESDFTALTESPSGFASAHYNAYPMAAFILYGQLTGQQAYVDAGEKGLTALMAAYPHTQREHSETQEQCRLILPLALLYEARPSERHRQWLYTVCEDLQQHRHASGAYLEWDSNYSATFSRREDTECSLLAENGDPVCDLLYSLNWLPLGLLQAWLATGDPAMKTRWQDICEFLLSVQLEAADPLINGAWPRAVDVERREVFAMPYDAGWGPWAVESGWTMGEITAGLALGLYQLEKQEDGGI